MTKELELVLELLRDLKGELGNDFQLSTQYITSSLGPNAHPMRPDIIVNNPNTEDAFMLEYKGGNKSDDLPLADGALLLEVMKANPEIHPIVISVPQVSEKLKSILEEQKVRVIQHRSEKDTVKQLVSIIRKGNAGLR